MNKFNWGHGLTIFILLFILTMVGMVVYSFQQTNEMIDDNYYQKEVEYQNLINRKQRLHQLLHNESLWVDSNQCIYLKLPQNSYDAALKGTIEMVKIDNQKFDMTLPLVVNAEGYQSIPKNTLEKGSYRMRVKWNTMSDSFYYDQTIFINK